MNELNEMDLERVACGKDKGPCLASCAAECAAKCLATPAAARRAVGKAAAGVGAASC